jgi:hypothetical protein
MIGIADADHGYGYADRHHAAARVAVALRGAGSARPGVPGRLPITP